jgi:hypothetical protein
MKILRIFPRKTNATPNDENVIINRMPELFDFADKIKISVTFTWDRPQAEKLFQAWRYVAPTEVGGPAIGLPGKEFTPGMFLKNGYTITSRGCSNKCWFCSVWKRESGITELPIKPGWIIQDDNLLACSDQHIINVFDMLRQQNKPVKFTGGIEAKLLKQWHVDLIASIKLDELFCAYDTKDDLEPLIEAGKMFNAANITLKNRKARCYVLVGFPSDTFEKAEKRIEQTIKAGFFPFAMLYKNNEGEVDSSWRKFQRQWANIVIASVNCKKYLKKWN